jgi:2-hydroxychromene-2-carboxylate isomerase
LFYRDFIESGLSIAAHCYQPGCQHRVTLDLERLAERFGMDTPFDRHKLRCSACGSRNVQVRVSALSGLAG